MGTETNVEIDRWPSQATKFELPCNALTELGEKGTATADNSTISSVKDIDRKTVVLNAVPLATAVTHVASVHPQLNKITGA
jgi:hypothetical protein